MTDRSGRSPATPSLAFDAVELITTVAHELRSPLVAVRNLTGLLATRWDDLDDDQRLALVRQVGRESDRAGRLVAELLDVSRLESGGLELHRRLVDLRALAGDVVARLALEWPALDPTMRFSDTFPEVYADPDRIDQVLTNLVENACKYAGPDGVSIGGAPGPGPHSITVWVGDRGPGIADADRPRVFDRSFRREGGRPTGIGFGLWICRGLVEAHGGEIDWDPGPTEGAVIRFTLPTEAFERLHPR